MSYNPDDAVDSRLGHSSFLYAATIICTLLQVSCGTNFAQCSAWPVSFRDVHPAPTGPLAAPGWLGSKQLTGAAVYTVTYLFPVGQTTSYPFLTTVKDWKMFQHG